MTIRQTLRMLLLPAKPGSEAHCELALQTRLTVLGVAADDYLSWVTLELEKWIETKTPSLQLRSVVNAVILAACQEADAAIQAYGQRLADNYFQLHQKLMSEHLMQHEEAVAFLSHTFLIAHLTHAEKLSAAQTSNLLSQRDKRAKFSRQAVVSALEVMRLAPTFSLAEITALYERDASEELAAFADADFLTAAEIVAAAGEKLGFPGDLFAALRTLTPTANPAGGLLSPFTPYLQMLHYQCSAAEFFDHAITDIYEFSPRGDSSNWLHAKYPDSIAGAGNAFLNNAKSVDVLDSGWVRSKKVRERPGAAALLSIFEGLQAMGFSARRELAWWIRLWLHRIIRIASTVVIEIPNNLQPAQVNALLTTVAAQNTETFGILEQRSVDAVAKTMHLGWRARGLGDSVNATNISRAKIGDCEFLDPATRSIKAYESHGGVLRALYVNEHIATLRKSILRRIDELNAIDDLAAWNTEVVFVAHSVEGLIPPSVNIAGLLINISTTTFEAFFAPHAAAVTPALDLSIQECLLRPLQEQRIPNEVRRTLLDILQQT